MTDSPMPKIIVPREGPRVWCRVCEQWIIVSYIDVKTRKIPRHKRPDEPKYQCPGSGKRFNEKDLIGG
jgi:hypothetical protein